MNTNSGMTLHQLAAQALPLGIAERQVKIRKDIGFVALMGAVSIGLLYLWSLMPAGAPARATLVISLAIAVVAGAYGIGAAVSHCRALRRYRRQTRRLGI